MKWKWNEKKPNKSDLSLLQADKLLLLKIHSFSDLQDCLQHSGHLTYNSDSFVCNKLEETKATHKPIHGFASEHVQWH